MPLEVVPCRSPEEVLAGLAPIMHYFGASPTPERGTRVVPFMEPSRAFQAREDDRIVGGCGSFPFEVTVPGGVVRVAGLSVVGVLPTHRRRGIMRRMMRAQLDDVHARGEPVAMLWASEDTIYERFGYGLASLSGEMDLPKSAAFFARPFDSRGELRRLDEEEAAAPFAEVHERVRLVYPGMLARSTEWWRNRILADPAERRMGGGELNRVLLTLDGRPSGYALYRMHQKFESGITAGYVNVLEAVGVGDEATREIWRFLLDIDWVARVKAQLLPIDHPLLLLLARPREMNFRLRDGVWVRLVDLPSALAARRLAEAQPVVVEVADAFCPWNAGRWRLGPGGAERSAAEPELACDVTALGSAYLGGFTFRRLARAGRVVELREGAVARADGLFTAERAPWCPEIF